ncbi:FG-GAP-like repeat-containing protein, partial [uncultured Muriicola sp.]|uniref:FG-GAP-like repeat-containing protein n=1 Tax=uncultured Muriicola sp. TaxID=1583102 RepID=UPI002624F110
THAFGAVWADMNGDDKKDLVTVSEWGTPKIYRNSGRRLAKMPSSLDSLDGLWNVVEAADLDNDGDLDLVLGNQGANLHYKPTLKNPMKMWINDFDGNGTIEQIVTLNENGKDYPLHQKKELTNQIVSLKKQNLKASEYAKKTINELWPAEVFDNSIMKKSGIAESIIAINEGGGKFSIKILPPRVQLSCICGIACTDINNDGYIDLIMGGNNFEFKPQYSRLDANYGNVLLGNKELNYQWEDYSKSGFFIKEEIKHLKKFKDRNGNKFVIAALNDAQPKIYRLND